MPVKIIFDWRTIVPVLIMFVVTAVETVGDISGVMEGGMGREATEQRTVFVRCYLRRSDFYFRCYFWCTA